MQLARAGVRALVVDVVRVVLVLIARVVVQAVSAQFSQPVFCSWRCTLYSKKIGAIMRRWRESSRL